MTSVDLNSINRTQSYVVTRLAYKKECPLTSCKGPGHFPSKVNMTLEKVRNQRTR